MLQVDHIVKERFAFIHLLDFVLNNYEFHYTSIQLRYPTFEDALHDLDDCLALCHLYATFTNTKSVPRKHVRFILLHGQLASFICRTQFSFVCRILNHYHIRLSWPQIETCRRLCSEFASFCIVKRALRAAFVSIKGIYYQVELNGEHVLWVTPHNFSHQVCICTCTYTLAMFHCPPLLLSSTLFLYSTLLYSTLSPLVSQNANGA